MGIFELSSGRTGGTDLAYGSMAESSEPGKDTIVAGKYRLERLLGRGGMGSVWEGVHVTLGTRVAVKFIEAAFANQPEIRDRFFNEAFAAARLKSKHIVQVYDHGLDDAGRPYIVMEFLSGEPLDQRLVREGTLSLSEAASVLSQVSRAVKCAHEAGIVHRDLKPENVFLVWDEEDQRDLVKVVDFGIAKFSDSSGVSSATRTGAVLGTPHFMSPEQARGLKSVDHRADIWSIGVIAYRAVSGALPFDGEAVGDLLVRICTAEPKPPSQHVPLPAAFDDWMRRSLNKQVEQRFDNVEDQAVALSRIAASHASVSGGLPLEPAGVIADTALGVVRSTRGERRRRGALGALLLTAGVVGVGIATLVLRHEAVPDGAAQPEPGPSAVLALDGVSTRVVEERPSAVAPTAGTPTGPLQIGTEGGPAAEAEAGGSAGGASGTATDLPENVQPRRPRHPTAPRSAQPAPRAAPVPRKSAPSGRSVSEELGY